MTTQLSAALVAIAIIVVAALRNVRSEPSKAA